MIELLPDVLRAVVTDIMLVLLLHTISTPKYSKKLPYMITTLAIVIINLGANTYFYMQDDYTSVVLVDFIMLLLISIALKFLFLERLSHWIFGFVTLLNVYAIIVFITWIAADFFPFPFYANTVLRILLFGGAILVFRRWALPVYRQVVERWYVYIPLLVVLLINILYYFVGGDDMEVTLTLGEWPMFLLIALAICIYISIFYAMKSTLREYALREENSIVRGQEALLQSELAAQDDFVEQAKQNRHDLRHHNAMLMEYLAREDLVGARTYLQQYDYELQTAKLMDYCKNRLVNAMVRRAVRRGKQAGATVTICADIPEELPLSSPELGVLISNLLENACEACEKSGGASPFIIMTAENENGRLKIEVRNTVGCQTSFNENGMPASTKPGGGTGTRSMDRTVKKYGGMLNFCQRENIFITQIILPLEERK